MITPPTYREIRNFSNLHSIKFYEVYEYLESINIDPLISDNFDVFVNLYRDLKKWVTNPKSSIYIQEFYNKYPKYTNSKDTLFQCMYEINLDKIILNKIFSTTRFKNVDGWIYSLAFKAPTTIDINILAKLIESDMNNPKSIWLFPYDKQNNYYDNSNLISTLKKFGFKKNRILESLTFISRPEIKHTTDSYYKKYKYFYDYLNNTQHGGGIDCNNTNIVNNTLGSCWNNTIQSIYAFYLGDYDLSVMQDGEYLFNKAQSLGLVAYLPKSFYKSESKKQILISMLDSISKRWRNKKNKNTSLDTFLSEDEECEIKTMEIYMVELIGEKLPKDKNGKYILDNNIGGNIHHDFFMSLIFNVFFCGEIFDFKIYFINKKVNINNNNMYKYKFKDMRHPNFEKVAIKNINNLIGISVGLKQHATAIMKCTNSQFGEFNNYYDDNFKKIYTLNYKKFIYSIVDTAHLYELPNMYELIKPPKSSIKLAIIDTKHNKLLNKP